MTLPNSANFLNAATAAFLLLGLMVPVSDVDAESVRGEVRNQERREVEILLKINGGSIPASMIDNATTKDFLSLLPVTLTLDDYNGTEKISYLPKKLSTADAPAGFTPSIGDIAYYAPWGNVAIFYRDFRYSKGLVLLGRIQSGVEALTAQTPLKATIERLK